MAQQSIKLYARKWGLTNKSQPSTVQDISSLNQVYVTPGTQWLFVGFDAFPAALGSKRIYYSRGYFCADRKNNLQVADADFDPLTLTWSNQPNNKLLLFMADQSSSRMQDRTYDTIVTSVSAISKSTAAFCQTKTCFFVDNDQTETVPRSYIKLRTLNDGVSLPYIEVWYDDEIDVTGQISALFNGASPADGSVQNPASDIRFYWRYDPSGDYSCANGIAQANATFYWRKSGESSWNQISIADSTLAVTAPAYTFPGGATIEWKVRGTDTTGTTTETPVYTFTTPASQIKATAYPSGKSIDPRTALTFSWVYQSSVGDYAQSSTTIHYHLVGSAWQTYTVTGSVQSVSVPANTFPTGGTVEWYLEGTDACGTSSSTSTMSFKTVTTKVTQQGGPTDGYCDPRNAITFSWYLASDVGDYSQDHASFFWRISGASWTEIAVSGNTKSITFPANTFPVASTIEWYISATDTGGMTTQTDHYSFSTAASTAIATCVSPSGTAEDGSKPITFRWTVQNSDGTAPTRTVLLWKTTYESAQEWHTILDTTDNITEYSVAGGTFAAGPIQWKVYAYNRDDVKGPESDTSFICIVAPAPPSGLTATTVPLTAISWQSTGQEGYEITIDGEIAVKEYGPGVYSYKVPEPLQDGEHFITVRIQGLYGMWSNPATTSIFISNAPEGSIELSGEFDVDAELVFTETPSESGFTAHWYRDGIRIADTEDVREYTDRRVLGEHSYYVEIWHDSGYYTRSNTVTGVMESTSPRIAALDGGEWLDLQLSENSDREQGFDWSIEAAHFKTTASRWPVLELSPYETLSGSYECAFSDQEDLRRFESLRGKVVIVKTQRGNVVIGGLIQISKREKPFFTTVSFSVQQIHVEEV